jgi:catechol 2,3-dioxygenase-like lactoylglutathione lyase family enzyme
LAHKTLLIRGYDEALAFYIGKLGFTLVEGHSAPEQNKRWDLIEREVG